MRSRPFIWILLCLLCLAGAWLFWHQPANTRTKPSALQKVAVPKALPFTILSTNPVSIAAASVRTNKFAWRLSNTTKPIGELVNDRHAILLENALIDTGSPLNFSIPTHLQSQGDPGAYIVQARGPIDNAFRAMLASAGAEIVSYIPNDAYLVHTSKGGADGLAAQTLVQAVIPYEPYYKISSSMPVTVKQKLSSSAPKETHRVAGPSLLALAVKQAPLPAGTYLTLGLFSDGAAATVTQIEKLGGQIVARDNSPFGPVVRVQPPQNWTTLAALSGVQIVEPYHPRVHANDLSRATVGVAVDTQVSSNYLGLTGKNVMVEVNDSGIDATHPDLAGRVFGSPTIDTSGHGTHVAGIIAGDGRRSDTVTNASGSIMPATNGQFRGMAPLANLLSIDWNASDQELQAAAALTNALISNNSWNHGDAAYDLEAASYDAATRDALPEVTGSQPVLFVFSAGNAGNGDDTTDPGSGNADTIQSPATAKNVITVGAIQEFRNITNEVTNADGTISTPWQAETSTSYRIAGFSSRGNVGIGTEGTFGRYKPDVVAPGTSIISTRSSQWDIGTYFYQNPTNFNVQDFSVVVQADSLGAGEFPLVPTNTVQVTIQLFPNARSPVPFPDLPIYFGLVGSPTYPYITTNNQVSIPPDGGLTIPDILSSEAFYGFNFAISNITSEPINFDIVLDTITTNNPGNYFLVLSNLNQSLGEINPASTGPGPYYRYETGTSMAAADVSGVLALMQDYFTNTLRTTPSPALLKAMLINGARPTGAYDLQVQNNINFEGWGLINLPDSLPPGVTNRADANCSSFFIDQNPTNALATGDRHTFLVTINTNAAALPLRVTLAWTDPPGDPAAAIKLVNNLDLVVTNFDDPANPIIFYGNDIASGSIYNTPEGTNAPNLDSINNVENVFISQPLGANYSITVIGRGVNVNAVTAQTNNAAGVYAPNVVQDFALVISSGNGEATNAFTVTDNPIVSNPTADQQITFVTSTNKPLLNQLVGASTPLLGTNTIPLGTNLVWGGTNSIITLGMTNQWHFYVVTNTTGFTNAAFITFIPLTLSVPRMGVFADSVGNATRSEADIDLYVTTDPTLMNLNPVAISNCVNGAQVGASSGNIFNGASLGRGGTEFVVDTNSSPSIPGEVYYVGVYSEDQEASEFGFIPIFSQQPFSQMNPNGSQSVFGVPMPVDIPDGTPARPGHGYIFGLALYPMQMNRVVVTDTITHQNFGDLIGTLDHGGQNGLSQTVVLNNHDSLGNPPGPYTQIYDDSGQNNIFGSQPSDGPGSLNSFVGNQGNGVWLLTETDDSLTQTGSAIGFNMLIEPHQDLGNGITTTLGPLGWFYDYIDVPPGATNLTIYATNLTGTGLVDLFVKVGAIPTLTDTNEFGPAGLTNSGPLGPGNSISIGPPLAPGRYWVGLYNESLVPQTVYVIAKLGMGAVPGQTIFSSSGPAPILDDAVMTNSIFVTANQTISSVEAALRVDHPRVSDLVFHLISPDGTRVLLVENRGGTTTNGMGATTTVTNITPATSSGNGLPSTNVIDTGSTAGTVQISYNFYTQPDQMLVQYQGTNIFDSGIVNGSGVFTIAYGPGTNTQLTVIMNPTVYAGDGDLWDYTVNSSQAKYTYLVLTEDTNKTTTPIKFAPTPFVFTETNELAWFSGFEGGTDGIKTTGDYFAEGWHVDNFGGVRVYTNGQPLGAVPYQGDFYLQLGSGNPALISTNVATEPGKTYRLQFAYAENPAAVFIGQTGIVHVAVEGSYGDPAAVILDAEVVAGYSNSWANLNWKIASFQFMARSNFTRIAFFGYSIGGNVGGAEPLLDAVSLTKLAGDLYYLPEQSLDALKGENAQGQWQLEVWDNRVGATNPAPSLVSWQLRFNFPTTVSSIGTLTNGTPQTNVIPIGSIAYYLVTVPINADIATNILISPGGPLNLWFDQVTPPTGAGAGDYLLLGGSTNGTAILYTNGTPPLVPGSTYYLGVQNTNSFAVTNYTITVDFHLIPVPIVLTNGQPQTNTVPAGGIDYYLVNVPLNADWATNLLLFADGPLNVWFNPTNLPAATNPPDILLFGGATNGISIFGTNSIPTNIVPGGTYYLAVQNTNSIAVTYAIEVDFHLFTPTNAPAGPIVISSITATNIGGTNGFLLTWFAPTNDYFQVEWTDNLAPPAWNTFTNIIGYTGPVTPTNGLFSFFDDGSQTGGFGPMRFYRLILLQSTNVLALPFQAGRIIDALTPLVVTNTATDSNTNATLSYVLTSTVPGLPAPGIDANGIITWTPTLAQAGTVNIFTTVVTDNGVPPISATNSFTVTVNPLPVLISSVTVTTNGFFQLQWSAPTNYQFQVAWTTNLVPPVVWNYIPPTPPYITSVTTNFTFVDTNAPTAMKFYRLVEYP
jgi:subtilisin-like proprotein convertase family protein